MRRILFNLIVLNFFLCIQTITLNAQFELRSCKATADEDMIYRKVLDEDMLSILVLSQKENEVFLQRFNRESAELENTQVLTVPEAPGKKLNFEDLRKIKNQYFLFSSYLDKKADINTLFVSRIDRNGKNMSKLIELDIVNNVTKNIQRVYDIVVSKQQNKILTFRSKNLYTTDKVNFTLKVFDSDFNLAWKKEINIPEYTEEDFKVREIMVNEEGTVYCKVWINLTKEEKKKHKGVYSKYVVISFSKDDGEMTWYEVPFPETGFYYSTNFDINEKNEIFINGVYSLKSSIVLVMNGTYFAKFETGNPEVKAFNVFVFSDSFLKSWMDDPKPHESKHLQSFYAKRIDAMPDGGAIGIFHKLQARGGLRREESLIVLKYNPDGSVAWEKIILKSQPGNNEHYNYHGHCSFYDDNKIYFIYNDNPENIPTKNVKDIKPVNNFKNGSKTVVKSISSTGEIQDESWNWPVDSPALFCRFDWFEINEDIFYFMPLENGDCGLPDKKKCLYFGRIALNAN